MDSIAQRVEALRREKGWSKTELARRSQLHQQHIYKLLAGERTHISAETVIALARAFGTSADYLLGLTDKVAAGPEGARPRQLGGWQGQVWISPDFDDTDEDLLRAFEGADEDTA